MYLERYNLKRVMKTLSLLSGALNVMSVSRRFTTTKTCPYCGRDQSAAERIPRSWVTRSLLFFVPNRAYRCLGCRKKFIKIGVDWSPLKPGSYSEKSEVSFPVKSEGAASLPGVQTKSSLWLPPHTESSKCLIDEYKWHITRHPLKLIQRSFSLFHVR